MKKVKAGGYKGLEGWQGVPDVSGLAGFLIQAAGKRKVKAEG